MTQPVFIIDGIRSIIGSPHKSLRDFTSAGLSAFSIIELLKRNHLKKSCIDQVVIGNVVSAGGGQNIARQACVMGGLSHQTVSYTVNNVCGSGMLAVLQSVQTIKVLDAQVMMAGGTESATHSPYFINRNLMDGKGEKSCFDSIISDGLFCRLTGKIMGEIVEQLANKYKISRLKQDQYALESHQKAVRAQMDGVLDNEIFTIKTASGKIIEKDDRPRKAITLENLTNLPSAFASGGTVTSGNSSVACDGAASVIVASKKAVDQYQFKTKAKILGIESVMVNPKKTFEASVECILTLLTKCQLTLKDVDLFEISESFSAQSIFVKEKLNLSEEKINVHGGDIAIGHPLGAAGARVVVSLLNALEVHQKNIGIASIDYGGGGAMAMAIEMNNKR